MRKAIITGSGGGIGSATCEYFKDKGWYVIGVDKKERYDAEKTDEYHCCDLVDELKLESEFGKIARRHKSIDALVNNAAIELPMTLMQTTSDDWNKLMGINLRAPFLTVKYLRENLKYAKGAVVNVSSVVANHTSRDSGAYSTSKGALNAMTRALALELADYGVRVNSVSPGAINTPMLLSRLKNGSQPATDKELLQNMAKRIPLGRVGKPEDIAAVIYFLCDRDSSSFITGQEIIADGGVSAVLSSVRWEEK